MRNIVIVLLLITINIIHAQDVQNIQVIQGNYLDQTLPGDTPLVFAPGIVSDNFQQHGAPSFSPDGNEILWQTNQQTGKDNDEWITSSMTMRRNEGIWGPPAISPYSFMPFFSPDGKRIYFQPEGKNDISYVEKNGSGWSEPKSINLVSQYPELKQAFYPSVAQNGTLYFMASAIGQWNNVGIYRVELKNGEYTKPELLPKNINVPGNSRNWAPFIAPDESYLIFCSTRGLSQYDQGDLFICFRQPDSTWTEPENMGAPINTNQMERFSYVSPDGKFLFFTRDVPPDYLEDVFWVSSSIIEKLKRKAIQEKRLKQ